MSAETVKEVRVVKEMKEKSKEKKKEQRTDTIHPTHLHLPHNSLQHDDIRTLPLLDTLVKALEKDQTEKGIDKKEKSIAEMAKELLEEIPKKKDSIAIIAEHIKRLYANEINQQGYAQSSLQSYNPARDYGQGTSVKENSQMYGQTEGDDAKANSIEAQNNGAARLLDENSGAYRLSGGTKLQAFIMSDPKGRIHSTWNIIRVVNETAEGYIAQNNGLHYQGLS